MLAIATHFIECGGAKGESKVERTCVWESVVSSCRPCVTAHTAVLTPSVPSASTSVMEGPYLDPGGGVLPSAGDFAPRRGNAGMVQRVLWATMLLSHVCSSSAVFGWLWSIAPARQGLLLFRWPVPVQCGSDRHTHFRGNSTVVRAESSCRMTTRTCRH